MSSKDQNVQEKNNLFVDGPRDVNDFIIKENAEQAIIRMENMLKQNEVSDIDVRSDTFAWTALVATIMKQIHIGDKLIIMEWLLTRISPANINVDCYGGSTIQWAIGQNQPVIIRLLLNYGADVSKTKLTSIGIKSILYDSFARRDTSTALRQILREYRLNPPTREQICQRADVFRASRGESPRGLIVLPDFVPYVEADPFVEPDFYPLPPNRNHGIQVPSVAESKNPGGGNQNKDMKGGNNNYDKYLKYKNKYLKLKNQN